MLNARLEAESNDDLKAQDINTDKAGPVQFVLTDLHPHLDAWRAAAKKSGNLTFIADSVDAANAPKDLLAGLEGPRTKKKKVFRLFNLAFHHFDDGLAAQILRNTLETAEGFA